MVGWVGSWVRGSASGENDRGRPHSIHTPSKNKHPHSTHSPSPGPHLVVEVAEDLAAARHLRQKLVLRDLAVLPVALAQVLRLLLVRRLELRQPLLPDPLELRVHQVAVLVVLLLVREQVLVLQLLHDLRLPRLRHRRLLRRPRPRLRPPRALRLLRLGRPVRRARGPVHRGVLLGAALVPLCAVRVLLRQLLHRLAHAVVHGLRHVRKRVLPERGVHHLELGRLGHG